MTQLKPGASLADLQRYAVEHAIERGFNDADAVRECLLLAEEVGELAKAIRKQAGHGIDPRSSVGEVADELADILWVTVMIANISGVDLEQSFRKKEVANHGRVWARPSRAAGDAPSRSSGTQPANYPAKKDNYPV